jgi:hypothetical protein
VAAPIASAAAPNGDVLCRIGEAYAMAVYPFVAGQAHEFGDTFSPADRAAILPLITAVHGAPASVRGHARADDFVLGDGFVVLWEETQAGLPAQREPGWPLSPRMAAKFDEWFGPESGQADDEITVGLREAMLETLEEMGFGALTAEGWRVFAPVEEDENAGAFPRVSWPEGHVPPDNTGTQGPPG